MASNILIVDDDAAIRDSLHEFIMISGFTAFKSSSSEEALEILKEETIHVVITDIILPGMDGLDLTERIKSTYNTDVIVMTGYSGDYSYEEAINKGASDLIFKPVRFEELLLRLKRVLKERRLTNERIEMLEKLKKLAITDGLTRLYNSRHFYNQMELEADRSNRYNHPLALLLLDIDLFKEYNDTYGHLQGDKVLQRIGKIIKSCLRKMDTAYRYGGEEFTILLPETTAEEAKTVAERIRAGIEKVKFSPVPGNETNITISVGVTEYCKNEDLSEFVQRADRAMYLSKKNGRNRVSSIFGEKEVKQSVLPFSSKTS
ncbi:MAG: diguanylate cyclase [Deltaproteobacteria bacterium]|nr:diguanylate cyclase [Deltaproteobacteria bacterium]MBW2153407.1 diguanylate cyclase [Deltaproteobacteria bacterium]